MRRYVRELASITFVMFVFAELYGVIIAGSLYELASLLGHKQSLSEMLPLITIGAVIAGCLAFLLAILTTRHLKGDPYRFSPRLKAYFSVPEKLDTQNLLERLKTGFTNCEAKTSARFRAEWRPSISVDEVQSFYQRNIKRNQKRVIEITFLKGWDGFRECRVEVAIETGAPIKIFNGDGLNQVVLCALMGALGWEKWRVPIDEGGHPLW